MTIKSMGQAERARVPGDKNYLPLSELAEAEEDGSGSSRLPTPSLSEVVGTANSVTDSLNVIIKKACKGTIDVVISRKADGDAFAVLLP